MSKNKKNCKRKSCNIETTIDKKYVTISSDELKKLIISAIKEESDKEDDASLSGLSLVMQIFVVSFYALFYLAFTLIIFELFSAGTMSRYEVFQAIFYIMFDLIMILLGYYMAKSKSKNNISQHFTVLTTLIALFIAVFLR